MSMSWWRRLLLGVLPLFAWTGAQAQTVPAWQAAAGGAMAFDVATVRVSAPGTFSPPSFALSADDSFRPTGGEFSADFPLGVYINFAYKLAMSAEQTRASTANVPKEVKEAHFTVHAKGPATATKDQMRLMVQDLLRERFGFRAHYETAEVDALEMILKKPGVTGPKLRPHAEGPKCAEEGGEATANGVFPPVCAMFMARPTPERLTLMGSRNTTMALVASQAMVGLGKTVVDRTGLTGRWDFTLEFLQEPGRLLVTGAPQSAEPPPAPPQGPSFLEAVDDQLGLKFKPGKASLQVLVVDHVTMPTEN
jgi:uncharacterized protein (TIGR03435 family)